MYYLLLFFGVLCLLAFVAWRDPARGAVFPGVLAVQRRDRGLPAVAASGAIANRFFGGERKEDKPCLTPVDCVQTGRCAGHCGWR